MQTITEKQLDHELIERLTIKLGLLAKQWNIAKESDKPEELEELTHTYTHMLKSLMALGYDKWLNLDAELPDEYMPEEYLNRYFK
jgi:hypothetical protein